MYTLKTTLSDFERPINTSLEDSIYMPQNRNRRRGGAGSGGLSPLNNPPADDGSQTPHGPHATPATRNIGTATVQHPTQFRQVFPVQNDSTGANIRVSSSPMRNRPTPSFDKRVTGEPGVRFSFGPRTPDAGTRPARGPQADSSFQVVAETSQIAANSSTAGKDADKKPKQAAPGKIPYSRIHEQQSVSPAPSIETALHSAQPKCSSPLRLFNMGPRRPDFDTYPLSPTLEHVRKLRVDEQNRTFAQMGSNFAAMARTRSADVTVDEVPAKQNIEKHDGCKAERLVPEIAVSDREWSKPLHAIARPPPRNRPEADGPQKKESDVRYQLFLPSSTIPPSFIVEKKDMEKLSKAMAEVDVSQKLTSAPQAGGASGHKVAVSKPHNSVATKPAKRDEMVVDAKKDTGLQHTSAFVVEDDANRSTDSMASFASEEFEKVDTPNVDESEHNGAMRNWYKGFRR